LDPESSKEAVHHLLNRPWFCRIWVRNRTLCPAVMTKCRSGSRTVSRWTDMALLSRCDRGLCRSYPKSTETREPNL
jgi:hypothetical protein